jgi:hypothetical protein
VRLSWQGPPLILVLPFHPVGEPDIGGVKMLHQTPDSAIIKVIWRPHEVA